jgi:hypothetical protein
MELSRVRFKEFFPGGGCLNPPVKQNLGQGEREL